MHKLSWVGLLQAAAALTVLFTFLTAPDIPHHAVQLFSHFRLQYFAASLLLLLFFAWRQQVFYITALVAATAFNASTILPWYLSDDAAASDAPITLLHANVHSSNTDYDRLIELVSTEDPDLVFLQEITADWVDGLQVLLEDYPYTYAVPRAGNFGMAAYSKTPFDSVHHVDSPPLGHPTIVATLAIGDESVRVIYSHPTIPVGAYLYAARNEQLESLVELATQASGPVVLLGDLNASVWDRPLQHLQAVTRLKNARQGFGLNPTWPTFMPFAMIPIDHALVSEGITVVELYAGSGIGSDHLPLIVTLSL